MKKSRENDSSLELLLDTMCNTFGGVMFIAIALIVVLSMLSKSIVSQESDPAAMREELSRLEKAVQELQSRNIVHKEILENLKNDPRRLILQEIIMLEKELRDNEMNNQILQTRCAMLTQSNQVLEKRKNELTAAISAGEVQKHRESEENRRMEETIEKLQDEMKKLSAGHISFKTMTATKKVPYFLAVYDNRIWRIGPENLNGAPHSDMKHKKEGEYVICEINESVAGVPLLSGENISPEARALLDSLPEDRFPNFSLHSNSVMEFCIMREVLKNENRTHGVNTQFDIDKSFVYAVRKSSGDYEAY